ncbi:hypothetical protein Z043_114104 [Scleropages formosus]|uniref:Uncharacterized protein n=1 Tax=Scleropages formosus TaxID=113540 RepID=A0A0P7YIU9_SCLFO|nr:hypothetical protein Z043_114104 [Scleropages formosus]
MTECSASTPDSAMLDRLHHAVSAQGALLGSHEQSLHRTEETLQGLVTVLDASGLRDDLALGQHGHHLDQPPPCLWGCSHSRNGEAVTAHGVGCYCHTPCGLPILCTWR